MRVRPILGSGLCLALLTGAVTAADIAGPHQYVPPMQPMSFVSELRIGASAQDPWSPEKAPRTSPARSCSRNPSPPADLFTSYFIPRPHLGGSLNTRGDTSFAFAGLSWTVDITQRVFVEASFGGAMHNGNTQSNPALIPADRSALGCSPLFRESGSIGYRLSQNWSVMATVEHLSNAGACNQNRGLTNVGARLGYTF